MGTKRVKLSRPGSNPVRESDRRIQSAVGKLSRHERGKAALRAFRTFAKSKASGLGFVEMAELMALVREWAIGHRRDFVDEIEFLPEIGSMADAASQLEADLTLTLDAPFLEGNEGEAVDSAVMLVRRVEEILSEAK